MFESGIASPVALFSIVNVVVLYPFPYKDWTVAGCARRDSFSRGEQRMANPLVALRYE